MPTLNWIGKEKVLNHHQEVLYKREGEMSEFECRIISGIAGINSVAFWHRSLGRGNMMQF